MFFNLKTSCILCQFTLTNKNNICSKCVVSLPKITNPCMFCSEPLSDYFDSKVCKDCINKNTPLQIKCVFSYENSIKKIITAIKSNKDLRMLKFLIEQLTNRLTCDDFDAEVIVPIPSHQITKLTNGANIAEVLAKYLSKSLNIACINLLTKTKITKQQHTLTRKQRQQNLKKCFELSSTCTKVNKNSKILLIDDVVTTTSTMTEATNVLLQAGYKKVSGAAIAKTKLTTN